MKIYPINEIFYSLQGEGFHAGEAATFVRFSGCNLHCPFCDTNHFSGRKLSADEIAEAVAENPAQLVVLSGGEPSLFVDKSLIDLLHSRGKYISIETNGTNPLPPGIDWITFSPKIGMTEGGDAIALSHADEIKVVNVGQNLEFYFTLPQCKATTKMYLQPCFVDDEKERWDIFMSTIEIVKRDPRWILSAQLHRFLKIQ